MPELPWRLALNTYYGNDISTISRDLFTTLSEWMKTNLIIQIWSCFPRSNKSWTPLHSLNFPEFLGARYFASLLPSQLLCPRKRPQVWSQKPPGMPQTKNTLIAKQERKYPQKTNAFKCVQCKSCLVSAFIEFAYQSAWNLTFTKIVDSWYWLPFMQTRVWPTCSCWHIVAGRLGANGKRSSQHPQEIAVASLPFDFGNSVILLYCSLQRSFKHFYFARETVNILITKGTTVAFVTCDNSLKRFKTVHFAWIIYLSYPSRSFK